MPNIQKSFDRGAEWRRWDLQVHTPFSELNNGFGADFNEYAKQLLKKASNDSIAAIGITDYFCIDGYKSLLKYISNTEQMTADLGSDTVSRLSSLLLLPNIELRASVIIRDAKGADSRVNFHVIFSNEVPIEDIEEHFLREIKFSAEAAPDHPDERWALTTNNLAQLGKRLKSEHTKFQSYSDLFTGMMNAVVDHGEVSRVLEEKRSKFAGKFIICTPCDEDLSKCSWDGQGHQSRKLLLQKSHLLHSSNKNTREFGLGKRHPTVAEFVNEFKTLKPCVHSSDAHDFASVFKSTDDRHTWIKADPTFNGLRQVLNEPEDRVCIDVLPDVLRRVRDHPTRVISTLDITRVSDAPLTEKWFDCSINFNPELIAVIGNKGSGKSALSDIIGLLGNTPRFAEFSFLRSEKFRSQKDNKAKYFRAALTWGDGTSDSADNLADNPPTASVEKIKYIPQSYLETICNEINVGKKSQFYSELEGVIFSHVSAAEQAGFPTLDSLLTNLTEEANKSIAAHSAQLREIVDAIVIAEEQLSDRHRATLTAQLEECKRELASLPAPIEKAKPEEDGPAHEANREITTNLELVQKNLRAIDQGIEQARARDGLLARRRITSTKLAARLRSLELAVKTALEEIAQDCQALDLDSSTLVQAKVDVAPVDALTRQIDEERSTIAANVSSTEPKSLTNAAITLRSQEHLLRQQLGAADREYHSYLQQKAEWESARAKIIGSPESVGTIKYFESQLLAVGDPLRVALKRLKLRRNRKLLEIFREKQRIRESYRKYYGAVQEFLTNEPLAKDDAFKLSFNVAINENGFAAAFLNMIHRGRVGPFMGEGGIQLRQRLGATDFDSARSVLRFAQRVLDDMRNFEGRKLEVIDQLRQGVSVSQLYRYVFELDYLSPIYSLQWDGKGIEQLSPGERGTLLLIFYLLVDRGVNPLVIDQPEENLDNQTVYRILVPCIKNAKKRRQLILVTHNPNLAVVCDAEQVIYAEMDKPDGNSVRYQSGSIENPAINRRIIDVLEGTRPAFDKRDDKYIPG